MFLHAGQNSMWVCSKKVKSAGTLIESGAHMVRGEKTKFVRGTSGRKKRLNVTVRKEISKRRDVYHVVWRKRKKGELSDRGSGRGKRSSRDKGNGGGTFAFRPARVRVGPDGEMLEVVVNKKKEKGRPVWESAHEGLPWQKGKNKPLPLSSWDGQTSGARSADAGKVKERRRL